MMGFKRSVCLITFALLATIAASAQTQAPAAGTGRWFYERAIVMATEQKPQVTSELEKAVQADPNLAEAHYFLGKQLLDAGNFDTAIGEFRATIKLAPDHLPARLGLATAFQKKKFLKESLSELEQIIPILNNKTFDLELAYIKSKIAEKDSDKHWETLTKRTSNFLDWIDDTIKDTPQQYQKYTLDRGLRDEAVLIELAGLYSAEEDSARESLPKFLQSIIAMREGFFPIALLQYGSTVQQSQPKLALESYESSVAQLKMLGFKEGEDFDVTAITELKKTLSAEKQPARQQP
jgi:tetratricopeptide (TPR) repeat protein